jgi:hypothetical protein
MPIIGEFPEAGIRVEIERSREGDPPWTYRGQAVTPIARWEMTAVVSAAGAVEVTMPAGAPDGTADRVRRIVRSSWKHAQDEGSRAPPRRIVRWRVDR